MVSATVGLVEPVPAGAVTPPSCSAGTPIVVGSGPTSITLQRVPCTGAPSGVQYRIRGYEVGGSTTPYVVVDLPTGVAQREVPGVVPTTLAPADRQLRPLRTAVAYRFTTSAADYDGTGPESAVTPVAIPPFATVASFTTRQYEDFTGATPTGGQLSAWQAAIEGGSLRPVDAIGSLVDQPYWQYHSGVVRLYKAYFERQPDTSGLNYWTDRRRTGTPLSTVSSNFASSSEFIAKYGPLTNTQFVTLVYQNVLDRAPDASGLSYWVGQLNSGARTRGQVMLSFSESAEHVTKSSVWVDAVNLSMGLLRRSPTNAEFAIWKVTGREDLIPLILALPTYTARPGVVLAAPPEPVRDHNALFTRFDEDYGFIGGDGGYSVRLPDGRDLWMFGDGAPGYLSATPAVADGARPQPIRILNSSRIKQYGYVNNLAVLTQDGTNEFQTLIGSDSTPASPTSFIPPLQPGNITWAAGMVVEPVSGGHRLRVFASDVGASSIGRKILAYDPSSLELLGATDPIPRPSYTDDQSRSALVNFGQTVLEDGGYYYVYGAWATGIFEFKTFVARVPVGELTDFAEWEYYSVGGTWSPTPSALQPVADDATSSIVKTPNGNYLLFLLRHWSSDPGEAKRIQAFAASSPTGPWLDTRNPATPRAWTYDIPEDPSIGLTGTYRTYLPLAHPQITDPTDPDRVLVGWSNSKAAPPDEPYLMYGYRPRFTWIDLSGL